MIGNRLKILAKINTENGKNGDEGSYNNWKTSKIYVYKLSYLKHINNMQK